MSPGSARVTERDLQAALWRLLAVSDSEDATAFLALLDGSRDALEATELPCWVAWRHALSARRSLVDGQPDAAAAEVSAAREALDKCPPDADTALAMAYLAHVEVAADHVDAAMLLAVDASLLTEQVGAGSPPSKALHQAHRWLSLTLSGLDLEELAVEQAERGHAVASGLPSLEDQWRMLLLSAHQHTELAQTLRRRGDTARARELAVVAISRATATRTSARSRSGCSSMPRGRSWPPATAAATGSACWSWARPRPPSATPPTRCTGSRPTAPRRHGRTCGAASCGRRCSSAAAGCGRPSGRPPSSAGTRWRTR